MGIFDRSTDATPTDAARFEQLCQVVSLGFDNFRKTGKALREIRDRELYKLHYRTFDECCRQKWKISAQHAGRLIDASTFAEEVEPTGSIPTSESQVRQLRALPKSERVDAWKEAAAEGATTEAIAAAVAKRKPRKAKKLKPIRLRVPGAWVIIEPNKKFSGTRETLEFALQQSQLEHSRDAA